MPDDVESSLAVEPGLCARCRHARVVPGARTTFWLCRLSLVDARFPRYPRLPVLRCAGFTEGNEATTSTRGGPVEKE
jgi:hypothetical protein